MKKLGLRQKEFCATYLLATADKELIYYKTGSSIIGFTDADWANHNDRKSFGGYAFIFAGVAVSWPVKKQNCVSISSTEAEYINLAEGAKEAIYLKSILFEICGKTDPIDMYSDNQSAIALSKNPLTTNKTKHIDITHHFIREKVNDKNIVLKYLSTAEMPADFLTKPLPREKHIFCAEALGITNKN